MYKLALLSFIAITLSACQSEPGQEAKSVVYRCQHGGLANVAYSEEKATLEYQGQVHYLTQAISASGARYRNAAFEWWSKGNEATLFRDDNGNAGDVLDECVAES